MEELRLAKLAITMEEGKVVHWLKQEGDEIVQGEPLVEIETDKATAEIESPVNGYLKQIVVPAGDSAQVDSCLAYLANSREELAQDLPAKDNPSSATESASPAPKPTVEAGAKSTTSGQAPSRVRAAPASRRLARELEVDLSQVSGSGPGGRIMPDDVREFGEGRDSTEESLLEERKPIIRFLERSLRSIPHISVSKEIQTDGLLQAKGDFPEVSITEILIKTLAGVVQNFPVFQSAFVNEELVQPDEIHIGVVVETGNGLAIPVVKNPGAQSLQEISHQLRTLRRKAEDKSLTQSDLEGATLSVSNLGMFGVDFFTAIVPPGQSAVLAVGQIRQVCTLAENSFKNVPMAWFNLVVDHRLIDGAVAGKFLSELEIALQKPVLD